MKSYIVLYSLKAFTNTLKKEKKSQRITFFSIETMFEIKKNFEDSFFSNIKKKQ